MANHERPEGVDVDIVLFHQLRPGDVLTVQTEAEAYHLQITEVEDYRWIKAAGYVHFPPAEPDRYDLGWEPLLYEVELRGSCDVYERPLANQPELLERWPNDGVLGRLVAHQGMCLVDRSGAGPIHITPPVTAINWSTLPVEN